ncbi:fatty acid cis/trans isomerase [Roseibium sp. MMSF_3544]|uniref:fatty acid cis/trans isomerase n=1 Tax=unclassified Roseibium TaxID=2629323 RepID=UPI00273D4D1A|nr:fatty acid cis/trans isomerase [Roseibium sp. MMSF_3544]
MQRDAVTQVRFIKLLAVFSILLCVSLLAGLHSASAEGTSQSASASTFQDVQDVLNKRCVVCHGCYDAPCQLKLSSPDGWQRGATKARVYDSSRLEDAPMTRLGIDAKTVPEWREKGFFSVTGSDSAPSTIEQLLKAGRNHDFKLGAALPDDLDIRPTRKDSCPSPDQLSGYLSNHPYGGMPFGTAPLPDGDYERLLTWAANGSPGGTARVELPADISDEIGKVEAFFNQETLRSRLVARYIYEHLFLAHLHIKDDDPRRFFRIIRSRTGPGEDPDEIPTRRPFDDPGGPFFYRLVPLDGTILHKEHIVYEIGSERVSRYNELFLENDWSLEALPAYSNEAGGNPLSTFQAIPPRSRYQFLLDDALFFVRTFIRGPVCYGQVAVNVIQDRFWVSFLDPDSDLSVTDPTYLQDAIPILELPVAVSEDDKFTERLKSFLLVSPIKYQEFRQDRYAQRAEMEGGLGYSDIWDGDGSNIDARLTIYRNFTSASVVTGSVGAIPKTAWVIDFPLFERIYYDLVAGFDVFGNVEHQLTTRIYMDILRREGERMFLYFLPPDIREQTHDDWYRGALVSLIDLWKESPIDTTTPSGVDFGTDRPKAEFLTGLLKIEPELWPLSDPINRCEGPDCAQPSTVAGQLRPLSGTPAPFAKYMPDIAVLIVEDGDATEVFTIVLDVAHSNVAFLFNEELLHREPENDDLTIVPGQFSSYPNLVFRVTSDDVPAFVQGIRDIRSQQDYLGVIERFGIRRTDRSFWETLDLIQAKLNEQSAIQAGLLDINRYHDPKPLDPIERLFEYRIRVD